MSSRKGTTVQCPLFQCVVRHLKELNPDVIGASLIQVKRSLESLDVKPNQTDLLFEH